MAFIPIAIGRGIAGLGSGIGRGLAGLGRGIGRGGGKAASLLQKGAPRGRPLKPNPSLRAAELANLALPDNSQEALEYRARYQASLAVTAVRAAARARGGQAALMAPTVRQVRTGEAGEDFKAAQITAGGALPVGRRHVAAQHLIFGSEFGSTFFRQFPPRLRSGYWFFRTVEAVMAKGSLEDPAADKAVRQWAGPTQQHD